MISSQPDKADSELKIEVATAEAEAEVSRSAVSLLTAMNRLTLAIPESTPVQAINAIGKFTAGVQGAGNQADQILANAVRTVSPIVRLSQRVLTRARANPAASIIISIAGLAGLILFLRRPSERHLHANMVASRRG